MMVNRRRVTWITLSLVILAVLLAGCKSEQTTETPVQDAETPSAAGLKGEDSGDSAPIRASGEVVPSRWMKVSFAYGGQIQLIKVQAGNLVQAGGELARLNDTPFQATLAEKQAQLLRAEVNLSELKNLPDPAELARAEAALSTAEASLNRATRIGSNEPELAAAQKQVDSAKAELTRLQQGASEDEIEASAAEVKAAAQAESLAQNALSQAVLTAPFSGQIVEVYQSQGEIVVPDEPFLLLADLESLHVITLDLSELDVIRIADGDPASVQFDALPGLTINGKVLHIASQATPGARVTYPVTIELDERPAELRWGMTAFVTINP